MSAVSDPARRRQQVERASQEWRSALIDVSGANRLLYFKETAATLTLEDAAPGPTAELLAGRPVRLSKLFPEPQRLVQAQRACKALAAKQREASEEYGVSVAFCAFGLATWPETPDEPASEASRASSGTLLSWKRDSVVPGRDRPEGPSTPGKRPSAPVLLRGVELVHLAGSSGVWELSLTGETQLNPVLVHVLAAQGTVLDEQDALESGDDTLDGVRLVHDYVRKACADVEGFRIEDRALLGAFSYLKQPMVVDCEDIEALMASDLVAALAGDDEAATAVRALRGRVEVNDPDYRPVDCEHLVVDADASQSFVVNAALAGRNLVVQGPPGTGKSQTIANVIAGLVAEGKRVLFVAQKRAAVTAVLDRLDGVGLADLTLDLFAAGASRRYVADQVGRVLDRQVSVGMPVTATLHQTLARSRDRLVSHRNALHVRRHAWGATVAELLAEAAALPCGAATDLRLPGATLGGWNPQTLEALAAALGELVDKGGLDADRLTRPGWSPTALTTPVRVAHANETLTRIRNETLPQTQEQLEAVTADTGCDQPWRIAEANQMLTFLDECELLLATVPGALDPALDVAGLEGLLASTDKAYRKTMSRPMGWAERRRARKQARLTLAEPGAPDRPDDKQLHQLLLRAQTARSTWVASGSRTSIHSIRALPVARASIAALAQDLAELQPALQELDLTETPIEELSEVLIRLAADHDRAQLPRLHELEGALRDAGLGPMLSELRRRSSTRGEPGRDGSLAGSMLRHAAVHSALEHALTTDQALAGVTGNDLGTATLQFQRHDDQHLAANRARVRRAAAVRLTETLDAHPKQHSDVKREVSKKRNFLAIRTLFTQAPDVLCAAKPCWAMSPLQVSRLLPAKPCFDVVIFDEASQVKPADAIPALVRAPQVIVAGDSRQLPPTEFFTKVLEDPADAPVSSRDAVAADAAALAAEADSEDAALRGSTERVASTPRRPGDTFTRDAESLLFAMDNVLAGQSRRLLWHYRSRDSRLIAVSNAYVYDGSLTTFPAAEVDDVLRHEVVAYSPGVNGGSNSPDAEVQRVVDLVCEHARFRPGETLGVITFGIVHNRRVEAALEAAFAAEPELEQALNPSEREPFFVKNIERVQGDERDAIILSVGYGKNPAGRLSLFWGPLLKAGGERRLNVAISRAKSRLTLVTSFAADDVAEDGHASQGFALMYRFLRFMASGGTELAADGLRDVPLNAFEMDIRERLVAAGLDVDSQVGVGAYRLDFAVRHPEHPGRYVLAIEADGASYHSGHIARERDRLRQRLLEARGWTFHRIWSTDWFNDADRELARIVAAYEAALQASNAAASQQQEARPDAAETQAAWHIPQPRREVPRPYLVPGQTIDRYPHRDLVALVRHVRSDGVLRTRDDELTVLIRELGFQKRGQRIVAALEAAQNAVR